MRSKKRLFWCITVVLVSFGGCVEQGAAAAEQGDFAGAIEHLRVAHEQNPMDVNVAYNLAVVLDAAGRLEKALAKYLLAEELSGGRDEQIRMDAERVEKVPWQREAAKDGRKA